MKNYARITLQSNTKIFIWTEVECGQILALELIKQTWADKARDEGRWKQERILIADDCGSLHEENFAYAVEILDKYGIESTIKNLKTILEGLQKETTKSILGTA